MVIGIKLKFYINFYISLFLIWNGLKIRSVFVELTCEKHNETMEAESAVCRHLFDYCKFRTSCVIHFHGNEKMREEKGDSVHNLSQVDEDQHKMNSFQLRFDKSESGLLPAIAQEFQSGEVLMLAYINRIAWEKTLETGKAHYWSRSRNRLWLKGESSGHVQLIREILVDCDDDTVVFKVEQLGGAACHTGHRSCFFRRVEGGEVSQVGTRVFDPRDVYGGK
jgi:phosphoribosyl-AMP cyclohydrolase